MQSRKQCVIPVITKMALWQLMHLGTWCTPCAQAHKLLQSHCSDNQEGTLLSWLQIYYYAHLASVRFDYCVCCGSLMTITYCWISYKNGYAGLYSDWKSVLSKPPRYFTSWKLSFKQHTDSANWNINKGISVIKKIWHCCPLQFTKLF